jgi:3-oxoadipate enol-lactonase
VLWPSLYCTGRVFADQASALGVDFRVLTLDPPGHGRSGMPPVRFSLEQTARATFDVMDAFGVDAARVVGGAWGGMVGVQMAVMDPGRVSALVLINSPLDRWRGRQRLEMASLAQLLRIGGPSAAAGLLLSGMLSRATRAARPEVVEPLRRDFLALDRVALSRAARSAMLDRPSLLPVLGRVSVPTLVLAGSDDGLVPIEKSRAEAALIPGAVFVVVDGTAHLSAYEAPEVVTSLIREFLR